MSQKPYKPKSIEEAHRWMAKAIDVLEEALSGYIASIFAENVRASFPSPVLSFGSSQVPIRSPQ